MYSEGRARIKHYTKAFLNPNAALSRDLSVAFVKSVADRKTRLLDSTAATGIRGIRYALETQVQARNITLIDMNRNAFLAMKKNLLFNRVKAKGLNQSIQEFANTTREKFGIIDFDPFGGVSTNLQDLIKVSERNGYLMATVTDTAVLCGAHAKACIRLYDARPLHNELCHEAGIRILIGHIARNAALFDLGIEVLLSISYMHYMRVFVRLIHGSERAHESLNELGYVHYCNSCRRWSYEKAFFPDMAKCPGCKSVMETAGKMWLGNLYDKRILNSMQRELSGKALDFVLGLKEEIDTPFYYSIPEMTSKMRVSSVSPARVVEILKKKGFSASGTHMHGSSIKTDAPFERIQGVVRALSGN